MKVQHSLYISKINILILKNLFLEPLPKRICTLHNFGIQYQMTHSLMCWKSGTSFHFPIRKYEKLAWSSNTHCSKKNCTRFGRYYLRASPPFRKKCDSANPCCGVDCASADTVLSCSPTLPRHSLTACWFVNYCSCTVK